MKKDFTQWHTRKEFLDHEKERPFFREAEVWFCALGVNVGFEQKGKYYFSFTLNEGVSTAILSQIRLIDSKRLQYRVGILKERDVLEIRKRLTQLLA